MSTKKQGSIEILDGFPKDVVAAEFHGHIDDEQFEKTLKPVVAERIKQEGKVKLLYVLGKDFAKVSGGFVWEDAGFAARHMRDVARIAIVTDKKWMRKAARFFARLVLPEVRVFRLKEYDAAREWITDNTPPVTPETEAEAEARRRMEEQARLILPIEE